MRKPLFRASTKHANCDRKEEIKMSKMYIETCNARHTVEEKMVNLTGILRSFFINHLFNNPNNQSCTKMLSYKTYPCNKNRDNISL